MAHPPLPTSLGDTWQARYEPIISLSSTGLPGDWWEVELPCKPGNLTRRPCLCAPYHHRLDWNIWFIGFKPHLQMLQQREGWVDKPYPHTAIGDTWHG